jgi:CAAX prenyl protease-like protein
MAPKPRELSVERWTVLHFPALARFLVAGTLGLTAFWLASSRMQMGLAFLVGWDTIAASVLLAVWPVIVRLDCARTRELSTREDETRATAGLLEVGASTVSLVGVFYALGQASQLHGVERIVMTTAAMITVPIAEELAFRGFLIRRLMSADFESRTLREFTYISILISSVAFGLMHGDRWIAGTVAGALYAAALVRRGRIGDAVVAHATTNALLAAWVLYSGRWGLW